MQRGRKRFNNNRGFTLIELLVVLVILGIMGTLVAPRIFKQLEGAKIQGARNQVTTLSQQLDIYRLNNGSYPEGLVDLVEQPADTIGWAGPYVKRSLLKDPWGNAWVYVLPGQHGDFDLYSLGADGQEGGEGNDADLASWE
ncbi:MAG: type II secretion system protein GspG [Gammaproteobacteria bacterium]|nr:MAG: type II secretion system protein GspG [Gammaproteobacteria bacterium]